MSDSRIRDSGAEVKLPSSLERYVAMLAELATNAEALPAFVRNLRLRVRSRCRTRQETRQALRRLAELARARLEGGARC